MTFDWNASYEWLAEEFRKETGLMAPAKDDPLCDDMNKRRREWNKWFESRNEQAWREWHERHGMLAAHNAGAQAAQPVAWRYLTPTGWHATTKIDKALGASIHHEMQPLYAQQPQPQTDAARDAKDAKRYRLLRARHFVRADNPNTSAYHCVGIFTSWLHASTIDREGLDAVLDAEIERGEREGE